jgi:hypothetical protein
MHKSKIFAIENSDADQMRFEILLATATKKGIAVQTGANFFNRERGNPPLSTNGELPYYEREGQPPYKHKKVPQFSATVVTISKAKYRSADHAMVQTAPLGGFAKTPNAAMIPVVAAIPPPLTATRARGGCQTKIHFQGRRPLQRKIPMRFNSASASVVTADRIVK